MVLFILLPPLFFCFWRALAPVGIQLEDRGDVSLAWMFFPGDPQQEFPCLLACLPAGSLGLYAVLQNCIHTSGSGLGMATWLVGWLASSLPCCCRDGRTEWPDGRDGTWLQGTEGTLFAWRCAAMAGWWLDHAGCGMTTLRVCSCAEQKTDTIHLSIYMVLEMV